MSDLITFDDFKSRLLQSAYESHQLLTWFEIAAFDVVDDMRESEAPEPYEEWERHWAGAISALDLSDEELSGTLSGSIIERLMSAPTGE